MSIFLSGALWVGGAAAVAAVAAILVRTLWPTDADTDCNDSVSQVFTIVGGLHAVLMAFVLISLFDSASTARDHSFREANALIALDWAGDSLPEPARGQVHELSRDYAVTVAEQEWPRMQAGDEVDGTGRAQLEHLRLAIENADTTTEWQHERKLGAADQLVEVYQARQDRLDASGSGVSTVVWFALIAGSVGAIVLPYLLRGAKLGTHALLMATLAGTITLLLFAIYQMQNPFSGGASVGPDAFRSAMDLLG